MGIIQKIEKIICVSIGRFVIITLINIIIAMLIASIFLSLNERPKPAAQPQTRIESKTDSYTLTDAYGRIWRLVKN